MTPAAKRKYMKRWRRAHVEQRRKTQAAWLRLNAQHVRDYAKRHYQLYGRRGHYTAAQRQAVDRKSYWKNPEARRARVRHWRETHPENARAISLRWYHANRDRGLANNAAWIKANAEYVTARRQRRYATERDQELNKQFAARVAGLPLNVKYLRRVLLEFKRWCKAQGFRRVNGRLVKAA